MILSFKFVVRPVPYISTMRSEGIIDKLIIDLNCHEGMLDEVWVTKHICDALDHVTLLKLDILYPPTQSNMMS